MQPPVLDYPCKRYREKDEQKAKNQGKTRYGESRIRKPHRYCTAWYPSQSWSRGTHEAATLAKRSSRISITTAMLNTRKARLRESRQALSGLLGMRFYVRELRPIHTAAAMVPLKANRTDPRALVWGMY